MSRTGSIAVSVLEDCNVGGYVKVKLPTHITKQADLIFRISLCPVHVTATQLPRSSTSTVVP